VTALPRLWVVRLDVTTRAARRWPSLPLGGLEAEGIRLGAGLMGGRPWAHVEAPSGAEAMALVARFLPWGVSTYDARPAVRLAA